MQQIFRGDIWIVDLGDKVGSEQKLTRPVVVVQNDLGNLHSPTVSILPLTSQSKKWMPTHSTLYKTLCLASVSMVLAEQVTTISKERFIKYIGKVEKSEMAEINNTIMVQLGLIEINKIAYA